MKKDRNAFFNEANFSQSSYMGMPNPMGVNNASYGGAQASQSFYSGPIPYNQPILNTPNNDFSDLESRLAKIERQINRLDARISKLETKGLVSTDNYENTTNMYML